MLIFGVTLQSLPETQAAGLKLQIKNFTDYVAMNTAVANKEVDLNAFQSYAYLVAFNAANKDKLRQSLHNLFRTNGYLFKQSKES